MPPLPPDSAAWFDAEVRPHEFRLRAWLKTYFPSESDVNDVLQETYVRVLQAREHTVIATPKAFVFAVARNVALGRVRRRQATGEKFLAEIDADDILDDSTDVPREVARAEELELLTKAIQSLPTRCRQILTLRKLYGLSQKEVAAELGISEHTVEAQGTIGLRKLAEYFERAERSGPAP